MTLIGSTATIQQPATVKINLKCEFFHVDYLQFQGEAYVSYVNQLLLHKEWLKKYNVYYLGVASIPS